MIESWSVAHALKYLLKLKNADFQGLDEDLIASIHNTIFLWHQNLSIFWTFLLLLLQFTRRWWHSHCRVLLVVGFEIKDFKEHPSKIKSKAECVNLTMFLIKWKHEICVLFQLFDYSRMSQEAINSTSRSINVNYGRKCCLLSLSCNKTLNTAEFITTSLGAYSPSAALVGVVA